VGCTLTCRFCHTGTQRLVRNLEPAEVLGQVMLARDALADWRADGAERRLTNVVMMGMGEPLYNFDNVARALKVAMNGDGIAISRRRITLSTAGVVPMMARCGEELGVNLAVSLHAVTDALRDELVPINRKYPLAALLEACRSYPGVNNARRITFEYVMLDGVNDTPADARELVRLLRPIPAKVNLIPFNPWPGTHFTCSPPAAIDRFAAILMEAGYASPIRTPRGQDIMAACGQLKSDSVRRRAERRPPAASPAAAP
jgi:23S rRNA (adenine2503-C2)-methyltransferase